MSTEFIDLGLSVKWASCNLGAYRPEAYGHYRTFDEAKEWEKSAPDGMRLPTKEELKELHDLCRWEWTSLNGVNGYKVTDQNGNSIFLPAAGYLNKGNGNVYNAGSNGNYWSSSVSNSNYAYGVSFSSSYVSAGYGNSYRYYGLAVRPVQDKHTNTMNWEEKYKEALEKAKALITRDTSAEVERDVIESIFPELKESEDERIRKELLDFINWEVEAVNVPEKYIGRVNSWLAWLEKQKDLCKKIEATIYGDIMKKMDKVRDKMLDCPDYDIKITTDDCSDKQIEQKPIEWKPQPESLEALMYAIEGKWEMIKPTSYLSRRLEDLYEGLVNTFNVNETWLRELPRAAAAGDIEELKSLKKLM